MADVCEYECKYNSPGHYYYLNLPIVVSLDWRATWGGWCPLSIRLVKFPATTWEAGDRGKY